MEEEKTLGQVGYEAYGETAGWTTFDGRLMPRWHQLAETHPGRETQRRWQVAACAVVLVASTHHVDVKGGS
jgi:hypothetical protein